MDPYAQLMIIEESPNMWDKGIPIIWDESRRAHRPSNSAFVLEPFPTPSANSNECDSFKYKLYPTPPTFFVEAPSSKEEAQSFYPF